MDQQPIRTPFKACRASSRRALNLLELTMVVAIVSLLAIASISRYGLASLGNGGAEGFARKIALSLVHARRSTISTGDNHYVQMNTSGSDIVSYTTIRRASGGDVQVDQTYSVPADVIVESGANVLEYDFDGAALGSYSVTVAGPDRTWTVSVVMVTGAVQVVEGP